MTALICASLLLLTAEPLGTYVLLTDAGVCDVAARGVTGDGKAELFAVCCDEQSDPLVKFVAVFVADESGGYPAKPAFRIDLAPSVSALFFAECDGTPPAELVAADAEGATVFGFADGHFAPIASPRFASLFPSGSKLPVFVKDAAEDLDDDGIDEWLVPVPSGYEIRTMKEALRRVPCHVTSEMQGESNAYIYHRLPAWRSFQVEGAPNKGVAFSSDAFADFAYGPDWSEHKRFKIPGATGEKWDASVKMEDIDGDGFPDLVVTQTKGTINLKATTHVYLAKGPFAYPDKSTATFEVAGAVASPLLIDVDGDGKRDIMMVSVPFGLGNIINYFVRQKLSAHIEVYLFKNGGFASKPDSSESFLLDAPESRERVVYAFGDFNGDGRVDVAVGSGADKVEIHTSSETRLVSSKPWATLHVPALGVARAYDLNGNKAKDLVLFHPEGENKKRIDVALF